MDNFSFGYLVLLCLQVAENLAQLMYSVMMTGYMFRNAQFRLDLQQSIAALPGDSSVKVIFICPNFNSCLLVFSKTKERSFHW